MNFDDFAQSAPSKRNAWIRAAGLSIYIRKPTGFSHNADFELASMEADEPGNGALTSFLDDYDAKYTFFVENILNDRLLAFLKKRGYRIIGKAGDLDVCMISARCWHRKDREGTSKP